jgi:hypothetical protein
VCSANFLVLDYEAFYFSKVSNFRGPEASERTSFIRAIAATVQKAKHLNGVLVVSIKLLIGRTRTEGKGGRVYTMGPVWSRYTKHYSPLPLGCIVHRKTPDDRPAADGKLKTERYRYTKNSPPLPLMTSF